VDDDVDYMVYDPDDYDCDGGMIDADYDDFDWRYDEVYYDDILTPVQKIKRGLRHWSWRLTHRIKWIVSKHYRDHYDDIPF